MAKKYSKDAHGLYRAFKDLSEIYHDSIISNYQEMMSGSIKTKDLSPGELIDDLACFMLEYEVMNDESEI